MPLHFAAWKEGLRRSGFAGEFSEELFYSLGGVPTLRIVEIINEKFGTRLVPEAVMHVKEEIYVEMLPRVRRIEPVVAFAEERVALGRPVAIASGGPRPVVDLSLRGAGIAHLFPVVITPEDVSAGKPSPEMFLLAAKRLGVRPEDCLVLEDAEMGRRAAVAAGMDYVMVPMVR